MVKLDDLIFGYRRIEIGKCDPARVMSSLLRSGLPSDLIREGVVVIRERDVERARKALLSFDVTFSEPMGLYGIFKKTKMKFAIAVCVIICAIAAFLLSELVWDVRIEGNNCVSDIEVCQSLEEAGLGIGMLWQGINKSAVENTVLANEKRLSWININRRGSVAYVTVAENKGNDEKAELEHVGYANIVAATDCVIEEITVTRGISAVKAGDTVKQGDVLIFGIIPEDGGGGFCFAEGKVVGRVFETVSVSVERESDIELRKTEKLSGLSLKIFNKEINIFKNYGNLGNGCGIIKEIDIFSLPVGKRLPIELSRTFVTVYERIPITYTDEQLTGMASSRLTNLTAGILASSLLYRIRTYGEFTEAGYVMSSDIEYATEVGVISRFTVE